MEGQEALKIVYPHMRSPAYTLLCVTQFTNHYVTSPFCAGEKRQPPV